MSWRHFFFSKGIIRTGKAEVVTSQVDSVSFSKKDPIVAQSVIPPRGEQLLSAAKNRKWKR